MAAGQSLGARRGIRMLERRVLAVFAIISTLSACATTEEFSFENIYDDVVALLTDDSDVSVTNGSDESVNLEEDAAPEVVPGDDEPARWLITNGCSLDSVTVDAEGIRTWKMRCPNSRWVTLVDKSL
tara:strand:- start:44 stop:424 length:381 start_codon:yes stop_codon:yes gene_type:complete